MKPELNDHYVDVPAFSRYAVSKSGTFINKRTRDVITKTQDPKSGKLMADFICDHLEVRKIQGPVKRPVFTAPLILTAFQGFCPESSVIYFDDDKTNEHAENLAWGPYDGSSLNDPLLPGNPYGRRLTSVDQELVKTLHAAGVPQTHIARRLCTTRMTVWRILHNWPCQTTKHDVMLRLVRLMVECKPNISTKRLAELLGMSVSGVGDYLKELRGSSL